MYILINSLINYCINRDRDAEIKRERESLRENAREEGGGEDFPLVMYARLSAWVWQCNFKLCHEGLAASNACI